MGKRLAVVDRKDLVFEKRGEAYTTSDIISEWSQVNRDKIKRVLRKHSDEFQMFGKLSLSYGRESTGGRRSEYYELNESQAMFLMTLLKNTDPVVRFKVALVKEFQEMKKFIRHKQTAEYKQARLESAETHKTQMAVLGRGLLTQCYIKPTSIANKAVAMMFGIDGRLKKSEMTTEQLHYHAVFLQKAVALIAAQKMGVEIPSVSDVVYAQIPEIRRLMLNA